MKPVYVVGTCDTKEAELRYAVERVTAAGATALLVDISTTPSTARADVTPEMVARHHPQGADAVLGHGDRGRAVTAMAEALTHYLLSRHDIGALLGLGGGGNTSMVTAAMRALPIGVPKLMVSTMASGNVAPYVGPTDIMMMHAVADVAGLNAITRTVIVAAAANPYDTWANQNGLAGAGALPTADPDNDGHTNNEEYAFGGNPKAANPSLLATTISGSNMIVSWFQRADAAAGAYKVKTTTNLSTTAFAVNDTLNAAVQAGPATPPPGYVSKQVSVAIVPGERNFLALAFEL